MPKTSLPKPRVFVDADVLFAGAASANEHSASLLILRLSEITLIEAVASQQVITEVERNLEAKLPAALPAFRLLVSRCLQVLPDPRREELAAHPDRADPKDLPILAAALKAGCPWLVTFNVRHFQPGHPDLVTLTPGEFILRLRFLLAELTFIEGEKE
jgi:predicted nucleic acid-binding protein